MNNYKEIKNLIHNEFKITKEEIQDLIRDAVRQEVRTIVNEKTEVIEKSMNNYVEYLVRQGLTDSGTYGEGFKERVSGMMSDAIGAFILNKLDFTLRVEGQEVDLAKGDKHGWRVIGRNRISFGKTEDER